MDEGLGPPSFSPICSFRLCACARASLSPVFYVCARTIFSSISVDGNIAEILRSCFLTDIKNRTGQGCYVHSPSPLMSSSARSHSVPTSATKSFYRCRCRKRSPRRSGVHWTRLSDARVSGVSSTRQYAKQYHIPFCDTTTWEESLAATRQCYLPWQPVGAKPSTNR